MTERLTTFICSICSKPIPLEECENTDAWGSPVHKECYAELMKEPKEPKKKGAARS